MQCTHFTDCHQLILWIFFVALLSVVSKISPKKKATVTLTCHLSDASEVTEYEWVHVTHDFNVSQSERSIQNWKVLKTDKMAEENSGEWACRFYGKKGILGNVTYHIPLMSKLTPLDLNFTVLC